MTIVPRRIAAEVRVLLPCMIIFRCKHFKSKDSLYTKEVEEGKVVTTDVVSYLNDLGRYLMYSPSIVKEIVTLHDGATMEKTWVGTTKFDYP